MWYHVVLSVTTADHVWMLIAQGGGFVLCDYSEPHRGLASDEPFLVIKAQRGNSANPQLRLWIRWNSTDFGRRSIWWFFIPGWCPLTLAVLPTAWLWYTDRRAKPWQCAKCRYDLRGLEGGVCPECGDTNAST